MTDNKILIGQTTTKVLRTFSIAAMFLNAIFLSQLDHLIKTISLQSFPVNKRDLRRRTTPLLCNIALRVPNICSANLVPKASAEAFNDE